MSEKSFPISRATTVFKQVMLAAAITFSSTVAAYSQGTVLFNNLAGDVLNAPIFDMNGTPLSGTAFYAQLYAGVEGTTEDKLAPVGASAHFWSGLGAGYLNVGVNGSRSIPGVPAGGTAVVQVRAWSAATGSTYEQAAASSDPSSQIGASIMINVPTEAGVLAQPALMFGLTSFSLTPVPEPSLVMLSSLVAGILLLRLKGPKPTQKN